MHHHTPQTLAAQSLRGRSMAVWALLPWALLSAAQTPPGSGGGSPGHPSQEQSPASAVTADSVRRLLPQNPRMFLKGCRDLAAVTFPAYRCRFIKNERIDDDLTGDQVIDVLYRHQPRRLLMNWTENPQGAKRLLWIASEGGTQQVRVRPSGVAGFFVSDITLDLNDPRVRSASRRPVSDFGFHATLDYIVRDQAAAHQAGALELSYVGEGRIDDRPTFELHRRLPFQGADGPYPDALCIMHIDREWLIPLSIRSYADPQRQTLLESYHLTRIRREPTLPDEDFEF